MTEVTPVSSEPSSGPPRARRRVWLLKLCLMAGASILTLAALEVALRITGLGTARALAPASSTSFRALVLRDEARDGARYTENLFPLPFNGLKGEYRVFFFGGSSTQGFPYSRDSYPVFFEKALNARGEGRSVKAFNFGVLQGSVRDARLLVEELLSWGVRLSAVVIHSANNELYYNRVRVLDEFHRPVRRILKALRDFSQLAALIDRRLPGTAVPEEAERLHQVYPLNEENVRLVLQAYEDDLVRIIHGCREKGVPVVLTTVPLNRDYWPPRFFVPPSAANADAERLEKLASEGTRLFYEGKRIEAAETFREVLEAAPDEPLSNFYLGRLLLEEGKTKEAQERLERALRNDVVRALRPIPELNERVRQVAQRYQGRGVFLIDFDQYLLDRHGLNGRKLFIDNCHGKLDTYLELGMLAARFFAEQRVLGGEARVSAPDEAVASRLRLGAQIEAKDLERARTFVEQLLGKDSPFLGEYLEDLEDYEAELRSDL